MNTYAYSVVNGDGDDGNPLAVWDYPAHWPITICAPSEDLALDILTYMVLDFADEFDCTAEYVTCSVYYSGGIESETVSLIRD